MKLKLTLIAVLTFFGALVIQAAPGDLDRTFSGDGKLTDGLGVANGVVIQSDGKMVVVRVADGFMIARYDPDGSPDPTFGDNGRVITPFGADSAEAKAVAIQSDGKIVVAGIVCPCDDWGTAAIALARYNPDGSLDLSFDGDGKVTTTIGDRATGYSIAIQPDNKIIVAGWSWVFGVNKDRFALARYNPEGSLDMSFDGDGIVTTSICSNCNDDLLGVALQSDGKILAAGGGFDGTFDGTKFIIVRYNADGTLDATFDSDGIVIVPIGIGAYATAVTTQADGRIVATGGTWFDLMNPLVSLNLDGSLDTTFDSDGILMMPIGGQSLIAIQSNGKIVAAGSIVSKNTDFALARYNKDGTIDRTFGLGGVTTADFDTTDDFVYAMALDKVQRAVVVGGSTGRCAVARFLMGSKRAVADFDGDERTDISVFRPSDSVWYLDQSTDGFEAVQFGLSTDKIAPGDYDGDGKADIAVYRDGTWYWLNSSTNSFSAFQFGSGNEVLVPADYTGDGRTELAVYRFGAWWMYDLANNQTTAVSFGLFTDQAVPADYDGDGRVDQAVYRDEGEWHLNLSSQGYSFVHFGLAVDQPVARDYDGDGKADIAVFRPSPNAYWYIRQSSDNAITATNWGLADDFTVPADYDGDGRADIAVYRSGIWYIVQSSNGGINTQHFGLSSDIPVASSRTQ